MDISTKWISTEYRNIQFHVDIVTFEIATKKSNIKSLSSLLENYTKLVQKGFINTFCVLENSASMFVGVHIQDFIKFIKPNLLNISNSRTYL